VTSEPESVLLRGSSVSVVAGAPLQALCFPCSSALLTLPLFNAIVCWIGHFAIKSPKCSEVNCSVAGAPVPNSPHLSRYGPCCRP
jgi:hypothetical protein